jgi:hypothetical protein
MLKLFRQSQEKSIKNSSMYPFTIPNWQVSGRVNLKDMRCGGGTDDCVVACDREKTLVIGSWHLPRSVGHRQLLTDAQRSYVTLGLKTKDVESKDLQKTVLMKAG